MKLKIVHLWILTTIISFFINLYTGGILTVATVMILIQDNDIENLKNVILSMETSSKEGK